MNKNIKVGIIGAGIQGVSNDRFKMTLLGFSKKNDLSSLQIKTAKYLFKDGSMIGLNEKLLCDYIEWIGNKRLHAIGLDNIYKTGTNPLPWTQKWISGSDVQVAPQETEITSYVLGGVTHDVDNKSFEGLSL